VSAKRTECLGITHLYIGIYIPSYKKKEKVEIVQDLIYYLDFWPGLSTFFSLILKKKGTNFLFCRIEIHSNNCI